MKAWESHISADYEANRVALRRAMKSKAVHPRRPGVGLSLGDVGTYKKRFFDNVSYGNICDLLSVDKFCTQVQKMNDRIRFSIGASLVACTKEEIKARGLKEGSCKFCLEKDKFFEISCRLTETSEIVFPKLHLENPILQANKGDRPKWKNDYAFVAALFRGKDWKYKQYIGSANKLEVLLDAPFSTNSEVAAALDFVYQSYSQSISVQIDNEENVIGFEIWGLTKPSFFFRKEERKLEKLKKREQQDYDEFEDEDELLCLI
jgi:hypothetical protein